MIKCKKNRKKIVKILMIIFIIFIAISSYFSFYVNPTICEANTAKIKSSTVSIIDSAIYGTLAKNDYDDLIAITKDSDGKIVLMQVNSKNANKLNNDIVSDIQSNLNSNTRISCLVPLGNFTGITSLSGVGPNINLKIVPIGSVHTNFVSQFISVGINQSFHKIYINISVDVCVLLPLYTKTITVKNQIMVAETVIVGEVPATYLNTDNLTNALNLIP